jgi:enoyl-CoA hydratase/carnithine racemase
MVAAAQNAAPSGGPTLRLTADGRVARITLDRQPLHIIDFAMMDALEAAVADVARAPAIAAMVLTSGGDKAFSAAALVKPITALSVVALPIIVAATSVTD